MGRHCAVRADEPFLLAGLRITQEISVDILNRYETMATNRAAEYEHRMMSKALALVRGQSPMFNIAPVLELVKQADRMGFDLVPRPKDGATLG
jgi:hypothetical protein